MKVLSLLVILTRIIPSNIEAYLIERLSKDYSTKRKYQKEFQFLKRNC